MTEVSALGTPDESRDFLKDSQKINAQTLAYTALPADRGKVIVFTGAGGVDLDLTASATLGDGWWVLLVNASAGDITIDPDGAELINGAASLLVEPEQRVYIYNTGATFYSAAEPKTPLPLSGGTMTGTLTLAADPVNPLEAATKQYADSIAAGIIFEDPVYAATTANLNATQAGAGVGATLTNAGAMAAFAVDGVSPPLNSRILVKDQTNQDENGCYTLTTVGSGAVNWVLTRATDYDQPAEIVPGTLFIVENGTVNAISSWVQTATVVTVDTDPIIFAQFSASPSSFAPANAEFLVLSANATLTNERVFTPSGGIDATDGGAGGNYTPFTSFVKNAQGGNYTVVAADRAKFIVYTGPGAETITLDDAPTLGDGFWVTIINDGAAGSIDITPTPPDTLFGLPSIPLSLGQSVTIYCDGVSEFWSTGEYELPDEVSANRELSNLVTTNINQSLFPDTDSTHDLGHLNFCWNVLFVKELRTSHTDTETYVLSAWENNTTFDKAFITFTAGNFAACTFSGDIESVTQAPNDNSLKLATTEYVDNATGGGAGANTALSNLAAVAINTSLISDTDLTDNLGSQAIRWNNIYAATLQTGDTAADTLRIGAWDVDGAAFVPFLTFTANNTPTGVLNDGVTATTQAASNNSTLVATTAYVDNQVSSIGANRALSNLNAVAVNISITPNVDDSINLGSTAKRWAQLYSDEVIIGNTGLQIADTNASHFVSFAIGSNITANRTFTLTTGDANRTLDISAANVTVSAFGATLVDDADAPTARGTLGLGTIATQASNNVTITGGSITGITDLVVADGGTGASSFTAYAVICGGTTSTNPLQSIAGVGTSGQVLTSNGAGALPTFQTNPTGAGALVYLATNSAAASSTVNFDNAITTTYDDYLLVVDNWVPNTNNTNMQYRIGTGGTPTYQSTNYISNARTNGTPTTGTTIMQGSGPNCSNTAANAAAWRLSLQNVNSGVNCASNGTGHCVVTSTAQPILCGSIWNQTTAVTSVQFFASSSTVTTATIKLYGIRKS